MSATETPVSGTAAPVAVEDCLFCKIAAGRIPSRKVYEDDDILVFHDIAPWAPVHVLMVPKSHATSLYDVTEAHAGVLGRMMTLAPRLMEQLGVTHGFRVVVNNGVDGGQEVPHVHIHVMGGPRPWSKG